MAAVPPIKRSGPGFARFASGDAVPVTFGGTGSTTAAAAAAALGLATPSYRNRIINGSFTVNQRAVSGTVTLAAGTYGHDRWKAGSSGCTYTFSGGANGDVTITITSGTLVQVIEGGVYLPEGGTYVLSWAGTAQARVYQGAASGSYATAPVAVTGLTAGTNATVEFGAGTMSLVQVEPGSISTAFERRDDEYRRCLRYFQRLGVSGAGNPRSQICLCQAQSTSQAIGYLPFNGDMRASPTVTFAAASNYRLLGNGGATTATAIGVNAGEVTYRGVTIAVTASIATGTALLLQSVDAPTAPAVVDASAEL